MWNRLSARIYDYLDGLTLADATAKDDGPSKDEEQEGSRFSSGFQQSAA